VRTRHLSTARRSVLVAGAAVLTLLGACTSTSDDATRTSLDALRPSPAAPDASPTTTAAPNRDCVDPTASLRPLAPLPPPGQMPGASYMATIQARGRLIVGVDQNTLRFGHRNPRTGVIEGFDVDLAREIARSIFGNPDAVQLTAVSTAERLPAVMEGRVDLVASLVTMTCPRWRDVSFSSQYYAAGQGLMVRRGSDIRGVADLGGRRVCATRGSTSADRIQQLAPEARLHEVTNRTECLIQLQEGAVDAITADDTILLGFKAQDRTTEILPERLSPEPYGLAIAKDHPDFVRFVNSVLEQLRADGTLADIATARLGDLRTADESTDPPTPTYQD
jgi:polar amino acid transport system substrate-binding protein